MDTEYVSCSRPRVAAVKMTKGPLILRSFAASIRHEPISGNRSRVIYQYNFAAQPAWLRVTLEPIIGWVFHRETSRRLLALKRFLEQSPARSST